MRQALGLVNALAPHLPHLQRRLGMFERRLGPALFQVNPA